MLPFHSLTSSSSTSTSSSLCFLTTSPFLHFSNPPSKLSSLPIKPLRFPTTSLQYDPSQHPQPQPPPPRTVFPGGYKRPEIKSPNIVLQVSADELLGDDVDGSPLDSIDSAVASGVGIVVVSAGEGSGGRLLYEAACLLKSVIRDRAFLLVADRVDIASAVNASGVLLSDQGLPTIVARNTMMKSESVVLPVVGRTVKTVNAALTASNSEGADFLILSSLLKADSALLMESLYENVKIPVFLENTWSEDDESLNQVSKILVSGASGVVTTLKGLKSHGEFLGKMLYDTLTENKRSQNEGVNNLNVFNATNGLSGTIGISNLVKLEVSEAQFIRKERHILAEAVNAIEKAAPLMEEVSLLNDAISQLDEPILLVIVGEFNSGKSTFINALLGGKFLKDGVVPTTNEITFLRYSEFDRVDQQSCERHPDGQYICYLPSPILEKMIIIDTPGTNVILQRQQRLTEEFVPRADLLLFVLSADRPLSESEVEFLRYTQQWKKKVVFLLNKADIYRTSSELDEAITFIRENVQRLLNVDDVKIFPISARSALEAKLAATDVDGQQDISASGTFSSSQSFVEFESFLYGFMDASTTAGLERIKIKLETPVVIAERLLSSCQTLVTQDCRYAKKDLESVNALMGTVKDYALRMESESASWRRQISSLIESAELRVLKLVESTLQLSNLDLAFSFIAKGEKSASIPATQSIHIDIVGPALSDAERLIEDYTNWLGENYVHEVTRYKEAFEKRWPSVCDSLSQLQSTTRNPIKEVDAESLKSIKEFSSTAAYKLFDQEIRQVFLGAFGGLGAAGLSASLLTSVLPTTLEDLMALALCSVGGFLAISNFPTRRQKVLNKVKGIADVVGSEIEKAMQKDLLATVKNVEDYVAVIGKPYNDAAQERLDQLLSTQEELTGIEKKLQALQVELQNFHLS